MRPSFFSRLPQLLLGTAHDTNSPQRLSLRQINLDVLSGLTVSLALVPEAIAFAFVAGVAPLVGLYAAFIVGLITAVFGGRPGMISGATGALAVVMVALVAQHGVQYLFATVILMGILQLFAGVMRWGKFIRMVPHPVMLGFVNGLAIVIGLAQIDQFKITNSAGQSDWLSGEALILTCGLVVATMVLIWVTPRLTRLVPAPLLAIGVVTAVVLGFDLDVQRVGDLASLSGGLPSFAIPMVPMTIETLMIIFPYALILSAIGLIESLLTLNLVGEMTNQRGGASQECLAQGAANLCTGFFGGMGGCAMIGQSMINVKSGGRSRISGIVAALFLLCFILYTGPVIEMIPIAALTGVMFMVVIGTFAWSSFRILHKIPLADAFVLVAVSSLTVIFDLAIAVAAGVVISALVFSWQNAVRIRARKHIESDGTKVYEIWGPLFFGSVQAFNQKFDIQGDPEKVTIDFIESRVSDHSGMEAIENLADKYIKEGKQLRLRHLSPDCINLLTKGNPKFEEIIERDIDDPRYYVVIDAEAPLKAQ